MTRRTQGTKHASRTASTAIEIARHIGGGERRILAALKEAGY